MKVKTFRLIAMLIMMSVNTISAHSATWQNHGILNYAVYDASGLLIAGNHCFVEFDIAPNSKQIKLMSVVGNVQLCDLPLHSEHAVWIVEKRLRHLVLAQYGDSVTVSITWVKDTLNDFCSFYDSYWSNIFNLNSNTESWQS